MTAWLNKSFAIPVTDQSGVGEARRLAIEVARSVGLDDTQTGRVSIVVSEAASNIVKHAGTGELVFRRLQNGTLSGLEILSLDRGPGMVSVSRCFEDGYSTAGSRGIGLGAIRRLSGNCEVYSIPGKGTVLWAEVWAKSERADTPPAWMGAVCVPKPGQVDCGDAWALAADPTRAVVLLADGLGHGPLAARAADEAVRVFLQEQGNSPTQVLHAAHGPLRSTRGAAVAAAEISFKEAIVHFAGIGNVAGSIQNGATSRSLVSLNGTLGHELHHIRQFSYPWEREGALIMHTDGLQSRWSIAAYPGLLQQHPSVVAGVLYRDFRRGNDDVTVLVLRERSPQ